MPAIVVSNLVDHSARAVFNSAERSGLNPRAGRSQILIGYQSISGALERQIAAIRNIDVEVRSQYDDSAWGTDFDRKSLFGSDIMNLLSTVVNRLIGLSGSTSAASVAILVVASFYPSTVFADLVFDASDDYSSTNNPNGVWSSGVKLSLTDSAFVFLNVNDGLSGLNAWHFPDAVNDAPGYGKNLGLDVVQGIAPGQVFLHPGDVPGANELATLRFTAPETGIYALQSQFFEGNTGETTGYVYRNGMQLFTSLTSSNPVFDTSLNLAAGDQVDFIVDRYLDTYVADATPLSVQFTTTAVPEPSSFALLVPFVGGILVRFRRRTQS